MRGEGARRADEGLSLEAAKTAKDLPPTERWSCFGGGFLAVFAARNDTTETPMETYSLDPFANEVCLRYISESSPMRRMLELSRAL
ncbi:MAG: hypothetical protein DMF56_16405 [Acidobacteria bacterium]|nr:MAG: hypothetical protein DMF56_16405 [Acidobacteriota bacterium]